MRKTHKLLGTTRTWKDTDGQTRKQRVECGAIFTSETGRLSVRIEAIPTTAAFDGWLAAVPVGESEPEPEHEHER